ncbi:hypothetical protein DES41_106423 [Pseudorhodoferax soli]|uniref:Uncharacterized protein n=1 Tax=Pseudorhodoferax soli TaxID=545864 RepID=A0A368XPT3_9BURK|nr:hypothetical protein DES41_106423 [Pseudorhodoferax soli]
MEGAAHRRDMLAHVLGVYLSALLLPRCEFQPGNGLERDQADHADPGQTVDFPTPSHDECSVDLLEQDGGQAADSLVQWPADRPALDLVPPSPHFAEGLSGLRASYRKNHGLPQQFQFAALEGIAKEVRQCVCAPSRLHAWSFNAQNLSEPPQNLDREIEQIRSFRTLFPHDHLHAVVVHRSTPSSRFDTARGPDARSSPTKEPNTIGARAGRCHTGTHHTRPCIRSGRFTRFLDGTLKSRTPNNSPIWPISAPFRSRRSTTVCRKLRADRPGMPILRNILR